MDRGPLHDLILEHLPRLPAQLQAAARHVLDRPEDVALMSMRALARAAGVQPASMTRFAQHIGLAGFEALREAHAEALRREAGAGTGLTAGAGPRLAGQQARGPAASAAAMLEGIGAGLADLGRPAPLAGLTHAAAAIATARRVFCLGRRACHPVAFTLDYLLRLAGIDSRLLDGAGGTGGDALGLAGPGDVLAVISVSPYAAEAVALTRAAAASGLGLVVLTDSAASPLVPLVAPAGSAVILPQTVTEAGLLPSLTPAFAAAEVLAALAAGLRGEAALSALARTDAHLAALHTHMTPRTRRPR